MTTKTCREELEQIVVRANMTGVDERTKLLARHIDALAAEVRELRKYVFDLDSEFDESPQTAKPSYDPHELVGYIAGSGGPQAAKPSESPPKPTLSGTCPACAGANPNCSWKPKPAESQAAAMNYIHLETQLAAAMRERDEYYDSLHEVRKQLADANESIAHFVGESDRFNHGYDAAVNEIPFDDDADEFFNMGWYWKMGDELRKQLAAAQKKAELWDIVESAKKVRYCTIHNSWEYFHNGMWPQCNTLAEAARKAKEKS